MLQVLVGRAGPQMTALKVPESKHTYVLFPWDFFPLLSPSKFFSLSTMTAPTKMIFWISGPTSQDIRLLQSVLLWKGERKTDSLCIRWLLRAVASPCQSGWSHRLCPEWTTSEISKEAQCPSDISLLWDLITLVLRKCIRKSIQSRLQA